MTVLAGLIAELPDVDLYRARFFAKERTTVMRRKGYLEVRRRRIIPKDA
jgi:hypothetical protein